MNRLIEHIQSGHYDAANGVLEEAMKRKLKSTLHASKKKLAARYAKLEGFAKAEISEDVSELDEARVGIVKARIRGGKIQRRKKVSLVPGMTMRGGSLVRMSVTERRKRRMGARRAKVKVRAKRSQMLRKRKISLMKRSRLGL